MVGIAPAGAMLSWTAHASDAGFRLLTVKDCRHDPRVVKASGARAG